MLFGIISLYKVATHKSPDKVTVSIPEPKDPWVNLSHVAAINFIGVSHFAIAPFPHSFTYF